MVGCGYDYHTPPDNLFADKLPNAPIEHLAEYAEEGGVIEDDVVVVGRVVADDASGSFYRAIVVEDASGGVEVRIGSWDLAALYPLGSQVAICAEGLAVARVDGVLTLGRTIYDWSGGRVEPIEPREEIARRVVVTDYAVAIEPQTKTIDALTEDDCGRLVRIEGVRYVGEPMVGWGTTEYGSEVDREFVDVDGRIILVRTSRYADFAERRVPKEEVAICGVLYRDRYKGEDVYVLKMRDLNDVEVVR
jgi:hypothetical protein